MVYTGLQMEPGKSITAASSTDGVNFGSPIRPPVIDSTARNALTPIEGCTIYNSDTKTLDMYDGSAWVSAGGGGTLGISAKFYWHGNALYKYSPDGDASMYAQQLLTSWVAPTSNWHYMNLETPAAEHVEFESSKTDDGENPDWSKSTFRNKDATETYYLLTYNGATTRDFRIQYTLSAETLTAGTAPYMSFIWHKNHVQNAATEATSRVISSSVQQASSMRHIIGGGCVTTSTIISMAQNDTLTLGIGTADQTKTLLISCVTVAISGTK